MEEVAPVVTPVATLSVDKGGTAGASDNTNAEVVVSANGMEEVKGVGEDRGQSILSGYAATKITHTLSEHSCILGTRPEYQRCFHGLGSDKKCELLVISKCLHV